MKKSTICLLLSSLILISGCAVSADDLENIKNTEYNKGYEDGLNAGYTFISSLNSTTGIGLKQKAENYLKNIGITDVEISSIRSNLLED